MSEQLLVCLFQGVFVVTCLLLFNRYGNQQLVLYNISCQPGQLSYFDLMDIDMEEANCMDPNLGRER